LTKSAELDIFRKKKGGQAMQLREAMQKQMLIMDGAMGTMLQNAGLKAGENPNLLNLTNPEAVENVHLAYISAGARMILTNTFGANERKLGSKAREMVAQGVAIAKRAAKATGTYVALDVGPLGELLAPMGQLSFHEAYEIFKNQMLAGAEAGADAIYIETITDLAEARCALLAAKENTDLPVICSMSFEKNMRTFMGVSLASMALCLGGLGADGLGINCSVGPKEIYPMVEELQRWTTLPLAVKPNAGLPTVVDGETIYQTTAEAFEKGDAKDCRARRIRSRRLLRHHAGIYPPVVAFGRLLPFSKAKRNPCRRLLVCPSCLL
jgi:5-methyltetrahydrofolate--homocysteine methyltransferase